MVQLTEYEKLSIDKLGKAIYEGKWSNEGLVQLIELAGGFLNLKSIQEYANIKGKSYNGIKKTKEIRTIFKHRFVIDNK